MSRTNLLCGLLWALLTAGSHAQGITGFGRATAGDTAGPASGEAAALLQRCNETQQARWQGVTHYLVDQSMMGSRVTLAYERFEFSGPDGVRRAAFRPMRQDSPYSSADLRAYAGAADEVGEALSREMEASGLPAGLLGSPGNDPWASTDPRVMMGGAATFARAAADAQEANAAERQAAAAEASRSAGHLDDFARRARIVGTEQIDGVDARHLRADRLGRRLSGTGSGELVIDEVDLWIATRECVPLRLKMAGVMTANGKSRPVTIERVDSKYERVPGSKMYESRRQIMRMQGVMTAEQEREMAAAQAKIADAEKRLQQLPPAQREMIMRQMGAQMATMKAMASGRAFEVVTEVHAIVVNPDSAALQKMQVRAAMPAAGAASAPPAEASRPAPPVAEPAKPQVQAATPSQRACLEEKIRSKQEAQKQERGMGRLLGAVARAAGQLGGADIARAINDMFTAKSTADDLAAAARELGLTEDEVTACTGAG